MDNKKGQSLIEFALIAPIMLFIALGSMDLGLMLWKKMLITEAASTAIRVAAMDSSEDDAIVIASIQNIADFVGDNEITIDRSHSIISASDAVQLTIQNDASYLTSFLDSDSVLLQTTVSTLKEY